MFLFPLKNLACEGLKHGMHFPKGLWAHNWSLMKILFALILILTVQSGHNFAQGMAAELAWHAQNWDWSHHHHYYCHYIKRLSNASFNLNSKLVLLWLEIYIFFFISRFGSWAREPCKNWVPGGMLMMMTASLFPFWIWIWIEMDTAACVPLDLFQHRFR